MVLQVLHIADILLWIVPAGSVAYVAFFAFVSLLRNRQQHSHSSASAFTESPTRFMVLFPAYHEDTVIRRSVSAFLRQDYPADHYQLVVISDHMQADTNEWLASQPLTLLQPVFEKSSKAKALQYAVERVENGERREEREKWRIVILDADNIVESDFLSRLDRCCRQGHRAIQCHRTAKNADNDIAALDGLSEEINNTIFRRAHNRVGLSSALIGSGMCFSYQWFATHVDRLSTAVEDRELEALLLREKIYIHYAEDIRVMDEKVASKDNFQRQRLRWMTGQVQALFSMLPYLPTAIRTCNIDYIDKTLQQALLPRSILLIVLPFMALVLTLLHWPWSLKWWGLFLLLCLSLLIATPRQLRTRALFGKAFALPSLAWRMTKNLAHIDKRDTTFHHTDHGK